MWHFELTKITARLFLPGKVFGDQFDGVAEIDLHLDGTAFAHGMQTRDGAPLRKHHFATLLIQLRTQHGVKIVEALRGRQHRRVRYCTTTLRRV